MNIAFLSGAIGIVLLALFKGSNAMAENETVDEFHQWDNLIKKYASKSSVPWTWVKAIMMNESNLGRAASVKRGLINPSDVQGSKSSDGKSWGLMQLTLPTARMFESSVTETGLNDPEVSVRIAVKYLDWLYGKKNGDQEAVVRGYNGGPGYLTTVAGKRDTPIYYSRFKNNLELVMSNL